MPKQNYSRQRTVISNILKTNANHLTVDQIAQQAKEKIPSISLATVYRNLHLLENKNEIQRLVVDKETTFYETFRGPHHHFICTNCKKIDHINNPNFDICLSCIENQNKFRIEEITTTIFGICNKCDS